MGLLTLLLVLSAAACLVDASAAVTKVTGTSAVTKVQGKSAGYGYGYNNNNNNGNNNYRNNNGYSNNNNYGNNNYDNNNNGNYGNNQQAYGQGGKQGHHGGGYGGGNGQNQGHNHGHSRGQHDHQLVPIKIPYIDENGCRFPGDIVCDPDALDPPVTYGLCILSDENKNLWKKPTTEIIVATCAPVGTQTLNNWCNDNERLLKAAGLIQQKEPHKNFYFHQEKYAVTLNPCILVIPA